MQKKLYLGAFMLAAAFGASAEFVTPEQALQRVASHSMQKVKGLTEVNKDLLFTFPSENGMATIYVFGTKGREGYMLLSADDAVAPVLGYADKGDFDADNMPPQMKAWLSEYARQVEFAREKGMPVYKAPAKDSRKPVDPLMKTIWNQSEPFNLYTPRVNGTATPTGCVATAMAQVMKYWNYPETAVGSGIITNPATGRNESMQLGAESFQWDKMLNAYNDTYTDEEADAVAYLMKACGYASQMSYSTYMSGTFSILAAKALVDNFLYNPNIRYCQRDYYTASQWDDMMYNEVSNGRPVLYGAQSTSGGHEFVCDGYSGDGFYHFNWGWGGMSDGYFILDSLNPGSIGIGGGAGGGFNYNQDILAGVQPEEEIIYQQNLTQFGELTGSVKNNRITFKVIRDGGTTQWVNTNIKEVNISIGVEITSVDGSMEPQYILNKTARIGAPDYRKAGEGYLTVSYSGINGQFSIDFPEDLPDGKYKLTIVTKTTDSDTWIPVLTESQAYNYIYVTKAGETLEVENMPTAVVTLDKAELKTDLYFGSFATFDITVTNDSDKEMTKGFYPQLFFNGQLHLIGDGVVLTLQPHETLVYEFTTQFRVMSGGTPTSRRTYELKWNDPGTNSYYDISETVEMLVSNTVPSLEINKFEIVGEEISKSIVPGAGMTEVYQITDIENIEIDLSLTNTRGFFGYPLYLAVFSPTSGSALMSSIFEPLLPLQEGESCDLSTTINMSIGTLNNTYMALLYYQGPKGMVQVPKADTLYLKLIGGSGVEEVIASEDNTPVYYNLQGIEVKNPERGSVLIKIQGDKTEKVIY